MNIPLRFDLAKIEIIGLYAYMPKGALKTKRFIFAQMVIKRPIELLAPARDLECGIAAINAGADAVYIGGPRFGAREDASNSVEDIEKLARYAHIFNAKVYVTLNTILFDHELDNANHLAQILYEAGADALIVQDMAFLMIDLPPLPLHASTQTHNFDIEKIKFLSDAGFSRIVLARELSLEQIGRIRKEVTAELEYFVHGSLCVSLSGQCYLSHAIGGRSANRGACAQPCRRKYTLTDGNSKILISDKHLLSLKDLNLSDYIGELAEAGLDSLKIEGRLKDVSYVKNITAYYRKKLDAVIEGSSLVNKASAGVVYLDFTPDAAKSFNRGSTDYFLHGRKNDIASPDTPKSLGEELGVVRYVTSGWFEISSDIVVSNNDGLVFLNRKGDATGIKVNKVSGKQIFPDTLNGIFPGARIFRNYDHRFSMLISSESAIRKLQVSIKLKALENNLTVIAESETGIYCLSSVPVNFTPAQNTEASCNAIKTQMSKAGNTPFEVISIDTGGCERYFFPASVLNSIRRSVLDQLKEKLEETKGTYTKPARIETSYPQASVGYEANISNTLAKKFYEKFNVEISDSALEVTSEDEGKKLMTTKHCLRYSLGYCPKYGTGGKEPELPLYLVDGNIKLRLEFDCKDCCMSIFLESR